MVLVELEYDNPVVFNPKNFNFGSKMAQNGPNMGPKWVQNESNMGPKWVPGSSSLLTSIFENEFPPFWAQLGPNLGPKWVQNWSKVGQKSMPKLNLKLYRLTEILLEFPNRWPRN